MNKEQEEIKRLDENQTKIVEQFNKLADAGKDLCKSVAELVAMTQDMEEVDKALRDKIENDMMGLLERVYGALDTRLERLDKSPKKIKQLEENQTKIVGHFNKLGDGTQRALLDLFEKTILNDTVIIHDRDDADGALRDKIENDMMGLVERAYGVLDTRLKRLESATDGQ